MATDVGKQQVVGRGSAAVIWTLIARAVGVTAGIAVALLIAAALLSAQ
jgi:hypothetical protein